ncbi:hypothetical protein ABC977_17430 [Thioalkalicoccus limnaeus]|uniref:Uncharacterized protein n=1 Tax=Thioalkalicoccus limnaeus TaxID=120681 RepID=A0ABV4BL21_9GAMM
MGHCQSFDLSQLDDVPRKDLPDLIPFFHGMLVRNRRRPERDDGVFSFKTPEEWLKAPGIRSRYEGLIFRRNPGDNEEAKRIVGVGHQLFDRALSQAGEWEGSLTRLRDLRSPLAVFQFQDAVTGQNGQVRQVVAGVTAHDDGKLVLVRDEVVLETLNQLKLGAWDLGDPLEHAVPQSLTSWLNEARAHAIAALDVLRLPFVKPLIGDLALFWPETSDKSGQR